MQAPFASEIISVKLFSISENAEKNIAEKARVSSPNPKSGKLGLISYLIRNSHWSPFEMEHMTLTIECPRDIGRQILRHWSFNFQEFSQRYANVDQLQPELFLREVRRQDLKNRQNSIPDLDPKVSKEAYKMQGKVWETCREVYRHMIKMGVAKECARVVLPEGLTMSRLHMDGNIRSWLHYCDLRSGHGTQSLHAQIALKARDIIQDKLPHIYNAFFVKRWTLDKIKADMKDNFPEAYEKYFGKK